MNRKSNALKASIWRGSTEGAYHQYEVPRFENQTVQDVGRRLGHSQVQTTARYAHLARDSVHEAARRVKAS